MHRSGDSIQLSTSAPTFQSKRDTDWHHNGHFRASLATFVLGSRRAVASWTCGALANLRDIFKWWMFRFLISESFLWPMDNKQSIDLHGFAAGAKSKIQHPPSQVGVKIAGSHAYYHHPRRRGLLREGILQIWNYWIDSFILLNRCRRDHLLRKKDLFMLH